MMAAAGHGGSAFDCWRSDEQLNVTYSMEGAQLLGRGKFSVVHRTTRIADGRAVVLKRIQVFDMGTKERNECMNEVKLLQSMTHPHIIAYLDCVIEHNELTVVMELAEQGDLSDLIKAALKAQRPLSEVEVWRHFSQIADALAYMHEKRVMHRDIKPSNVFVLAANHVKLGDLGVGRHFSSKTDMTHSTVRGDERAAGAAARPRALSSHTLPRTRTRALAGGDAVLHVARVHPGQDGLRLQVGHLVARLPAVRARQAAIALLRRQGARAARIARPHCPAAARLFSGPTSFDVLSQLRRWQVNFYVLGKKITSCQYEPVGDGYSAEVGELVSIMLQREPAERPTAVEVFERSRALLEARERAGGV
tara:strand:- start:258 stop:1349 length:1092 start_codon:yes stop_codon:yes gene_type:complete